MISSKILVCEGLVYLEVLLKKQACWPSAWGWHMHVQGGIVGERGEGEVANLALEQQSYFGMGDKE